MDLKIKDVAELLNVSATTIRRWLADGKIPAYRLNHQYRFNRTEIENWVMNQKLNGEKGVVASKEQKEKSSSKRGTKQFNFYRALHKGDVLFDIPGNTKEEVISSAMTHLSKKLHLDSDVLTEFLLDREKLMPTALGHGIAVPHTRDFLLDEHFDLITIAYPKNPIPYGALDGEPVHTLFFLFSCDGKRHLNLLSKIAHLCMDPKTLELLKRKPSKAELLPLIKSWEANIAPAEEEEDEIQAPTV